MEEQSTYIINQPGFIDNQMIKRVVIHGDNAETINAMLHTYGGRVTHVHVSGGVEEALKVETPKDVVLKVFCQSREDIIRYSRELKTARWFVCPLFPVEGVEDISFIASMDIAVDLLYRVDEMDEEILLNIVDYYLHQPGLEVPVEPFHTLFMAMLRKKAVHLWNLHMVFPGRFFYGNVDGIAGEPGELEAGEYLFNIDFQIGEFIRTGRESSVKRYLDGLSGEQPGCIGCEHFHHCFGWGKYKKNSCETWRAILDTLQKGVRELDSLRNQTMRRDTAKIGRNL